MEEKKTIEKVSRRNVKPTPPPLNEYARLYKERKPTQRGSGLALRQLLEYQMRLQERFKTIYDEI